ncbi:MAG: hypothetical protein WCP77_12280 [Roseococcus sp.]
MREGRDRVINRRHGQDRQQDGRRFRLDQGVGKGFTRRGGGGTQFAQNLLRAWRRGIAARGFRPDRKVPETAIFQAWRVHGGSHARNVWLLAHRKSKSLLQTGPENARKALRAKPYFF